jgi:hypothetical protein
MSVPRVGHTATLLLNGKVLICGGADRADSLGTVLDSAELYDPITETFAPAANMTSPRWHHSATLLPDGRVLIAGGTINPNAGGASNSVLSSSEIYDPVAGTFTAGSNMNAARMWHTATLLDNGNVLIAGGYGGSQGVGPDVRWASAELYDPSTATFSRTGGMTTERFNHRASLLPEGRVLIAGGAGRIDGPIPWVELYDPKSGVFSLAGATGSVDTVGPAIVSLLPTGDVLMALDTYDSPTINADLYDPLAALFTGTGKMRVPRIFTGTLLPSGSVLVAGQGTADLYDPTTGAFSATADMAVPRFNHTATPLPNGTVLMSGGITSVAYPENNALASAEVYRPN